MVTYIKVVHQSGHVRKSADRVMDLVTVAMGTFVMNPNLVSTKLFIFRIPVNRYS